MISTFCLPFSGRIIFGVVILCCVERRIAIGGGSDIDGGVLLESQHTRLICQAKIWPTESRPSEHSEGFDFDFVFSTKANISDHISMNDVIIETDVDYWQGAEIFGRKS